MPTSQVGGANAGQRDVQVSAMSFGAEFGDARTRGGIEPPWVRGRLTASVSVRGTETDAPLPARFVNASMAALEVAGASLVPEGSSRAFVYWSAGLAAACT